ncbi:MAG: Fe-S cluster assembly ATPase SufC [Candidatus Micrarchaeota archaeon]|nr:Fe-S cluster assembly ATPase SufC [Candidatus Micrarchaeota archaeon]
MPISLEKESHVLEVRNLHAGVDGKKVLRGVNLSVKSGEVHALMGPNGSGKSTLSAVIMGHPKDAVTKGDIRLDGKSILEMTPEARAKAGLFLAFQYPMEVPGVSVANFLRSAYNEKFEPMPVFQFSGFLKEKMISLGMDDRFAERYLNDGFSGGEKKRCEILQMAVLKPSIAVMDETDSGLDVDALKTVAQGAAALVKNEDMGVLLITHYPRILHHLKPDFVHVFKNGKIVKQGGFDLALELEKTGYGEAEVLHQTA